MWTPNTWLGLQTKLQRNIRGTVRTYTDSKTEMWKIKVILLGTLGTFPLCFLELKIITWTQAHQENSWGQGQISNVRPSIC